MELVGLYLDASVYFQQIQDDELRFRGRYTLLTLIGNFFIVLSPIYFESVVAIGLSVYDAQVR